MFKNLFTSIVTFVKTIFANQSAVTFVRRDVVKFVELVAVKDYLGAATVLVNDVNSLQTINVKEIVQQAKAVGVAISDFAPVVGKINQHLDTYPAHRVTVELEQKARDAIDLVQRVVASQGKV